MKKKILPLLLFILALHTLNCQGQNLPDSTRTLRIETNDGNLFTGSIMAEDSLTIILKTSNLGEVRIPKNIIRSQTVLFDKLLKGKDLWLPNLQSSRYFWAPNGYGIDKGKSYYQNIWVLYNQFSFGLTDNFSVGTGMMPLFLFNGSPTPVWIVPKISIPVSKDKFNLGTGAFLGSVIGVEGGFFGLLFGTATIGSRDKNFSLGVAYGFAGQEWMRNPIINFSAMIRTGPKGYFITENYIIPIEGETVAIISGGGRSMIRNVGLDYSLWIPIVQQGGFIAVPLLGVTVPLSKNVKKAK